MKKLFLIFFLLSGSAWAQKSLYFYSDADDKGKSDAVRVLVQNSGIPFREIMVGREPRLHAILLGGVELVIEVEGRLYQEFRPKTAADITTTFNGAPIVYPALPAVDPLITRTQTVSTLKNLLETNPTAWTVTQERQALYLLLLFAFKDLQNGTVY